MKLRTSITLLMLSTALPCVLAQTHLNVPFAIGTAHAQDAVTDVARQRYEDGVKAFDSGRYEDARTAFLQAYALKKHPAVLLNLGQSELRSGHYEDAGNHLQQFLRQHTGASAQQKTTAEKGIAEAKKKSGFVVVIADANGAQVSIDGVTIGTTPLLDPYFVKPGKHTVYASYQSKSATTQVDAKAGSAAAATLTLGTSGAATPPPPATTSEPPPPPPPATTSQPPPPPPSGTAPMNPYNMPPPANTMDQPPIGPVSGDMGGMGTMQPPPPPDETTPGTREPFFHWYKRKPIAWIGTGVTGLGLISGITFSIFTSYVGGKADEHAAEIKSFVRDNDLGDLKPCAPEDSGKPDAVVTVNGTTVDFNKACGTLREDLADYDTNFALATTGWILFGLGAVGTGTYIALDWYFKKPDSSSAKAEPPKTLMVAPVIAPGHQGLSVFGTF